MKKLYLCIAKHKGLAWITSPCLTKLKIKSGFRLIFFWSNTNQISPKIQKIFNNGKNIKNIIIFQYCLLNKQNIIIFDTLYNI